MEWEEIVACVLIAACITAATCLCRYIITLEPWFPHSGNAPECGLSQSSSDDDDDDSAVEIEVPLRPVTLQRRHSWS